MKKLVFITITLLVISLFASGFYFAKQRLENLNSVSFIVPTRIASPTATPTPTIILQASLDLKVLPNEYHIYQTFNNCGPASLSMALSYFDINVSQKVLGDALRPYQNPQGDNDDKSVTLKELGKKASDYGLIFYHRPNGNVDVIKKFIAYDLPMIARTLTTTSQDIGHFRVIKGYDDINKQIIQDDSLQGKNLRISYDEFADLWKAFNFEYLVLVKYDQEEIVRAILKEDFDDKKAWEKAVEERKKDLAQNPADVMGRFNLSVAYKNIGEYKRSVEEFEKVENNLSFRALWYNIEPIEAYFELDQFDRVFALTDKILNHENRAFSELYFLRSKIYRKLNNEIKASEEYEKAVIYNKNFSNLQE